MSEVSVPGVLALNSFSFFSYWKDFAVALAFAHATAARFQNLAVEASSTNHLFGFSTMIRCSDSPTLRGGKAPNQPSDGLFSTRVAHGLPCMRTSCA